MSLGAEDYGLYGVVGGMTVFITFFNNVLASSISRFYTFSVGQAKVALSEDEGVVECQAWFNTAVSIHTIVPLILVAVGYPIGVWMVRSFLAIPPDRIEPCIWVFRFACLSCFISMLNVPFHAMYTAKQYIAELTLYSFATTTVNVCFLYFMVTHPSDWLTRYAAWMCALAAIPQILICIRALKIFPECRFRKDMLFRVDRFKRLGVFAAWQLIGVLCGLLRGQGIAILINKFHGAKVNASMSVANTINSHSSTLSSAMLGAFTPAITTAYGAGDTDRMRTLVFSACKFGTLLSLIFVIPLMLELPEVLTLWLKEPPPYVFGLTALMLVSHIIDNLTYGHMVAVSASGRIALYHVLMGSISLLALPIAMMWAFCGGDPYTAICSIVITQVAYTIMRVVLSRRIVQLPIRPWALGIVVPLVILVFVCVAVGIIPHYMMAASFLRICVTMFISTAVFIPFSWFCVLNSEERAFVKTKVLCRIQSFFL
jgi:O-antigen/teichoic acid export membrane protein